jgi:hypothetical protein
MRNPDLFRISIADIPMTPEERKAAQDLVDSYWQTKEEDRAADSTKSVNAVSPQDEENTSDERAAT